MKGRLLDFSIQTNSGIISGDDGNRYTFTGDQWKENTTPERGTYVDFEIRDTEALGVYRALGAPAGGSGSLSGSRGQNIEGEKDRVAAGVLGILLGGLGIHKFYLGYTKEGIIHLVVFFVGMIPLFMGTLVISVIGLVEGIIYLTKTHEEFEQTYVVNTRPWF